MHSNKCISTVKPAFYEMKNCQMLSSWKPKRQDVCVCECVCNRVSQILSALPVSKSFKPTQANTSGWPRRTERCIIILSVKQLKEHSKESINILCNGRHNTRCYTAIYISMLVQILYSDVNIYKLKKKCVICDQIKQTWLHFNLRLKNEKYILPFKVNEHKFLKINWMKYVNAHQ